MLTELIIRSAIKAAPLKANPVTKKGTTELSDGGERGSGRLTLIIRVRAEAITAEWYAVWHRNSRRSKSKIGSYPTMTLAAARLKFREDFMPHIATGGTPVGPRARQAQKGVTVRELFESYIADLKRRDAASWRDNERILLGADGKSGAAKAIGYHAQAGMVKPADIIPHLAAIFERGSPASAQRTRLAISAAFSFAIRSANSYKTSGNPDWGITTNPVLAIPADREATTPGQRYLRPAEFREFWRWLEQRDHISATAPALRVLMACGQRVNEILPVSTATYDRAEQIIDWSKTKNGKQHAMPVPRQAADIFRGLHPSPAGYYFPSPQKVGEHLGTAAAWAQVETYIRETGADTFTPRDLRRTFKTLTGAAGLSKDIRDRLQNHADKDVSSKHYDRYEYMAEKRAAMLVWSDYLDRILAGALDNEVTRLREPAPAVMGL